MLERKVFVDPCGEELVIITGANCPVCENDYATIVGIMVGGDYGKSDVPLIKICPCGHITISKDFIHDIEIKEPDIGRWI